MVMCYECDQNTYTHLYLPGLCTPVNIRFAMACGLVTPHHTWNIALWNTHVRTSLRVNNLLQPCQV